MKYILTCLTFCFFCLQVSGQQRLRPNILWIMADDLSPDLGCYGNQLVHTPHVDRLAAQGVRFDQAFATNPVCSPSRSAIYTGMYQTTIGAHHHRTEQRSPLPEGIRVISEYFEEAGYFSSNGYGHPDSRPGKTDFNFEAVDIFDGTDWSQRQPGQPFFASVQIHYPHRTFEQDTLHPVDPDRVRLPPYYPDHPLARQDWSDYLESVQRMDRELGVVLDRLEKEKLLDNTVIFFFADQGRPHVRGKQWLYEGGIRVPLIVHWPGQIRPGVSDQLVSLIDLAISSLRVAGIDPPPHLQGRDFLDAGSPPRQYVFAGRNRTDAVVDHLRAVRSPQFKYIKNLMPERPYTQFGHYKMYNYPVLTLLHVLHQQGRLSAAQAAFMQPGKPPEELYDLQKDPFETVNLAEDPRYRDTLAAMRKVLAQWTEETEDVGAADPDDYQALLERRWEKYGERWQQRGIPDPRQIDYEQYLAWWEKELGIQHKTDPK